jgi:hypothetical protein
MLMLTNLIGFGVSRSGATSVAFQNSTTAQNSATVTGHSSIIAGDLLVYLDRHYAAGFPASVTPSGFTNVLDFTVNTDTKMMLSYKIATGAEASAAITGMNSPNGNKILAVFRPNNPITLASSQDPGSEGTAADPTPQTITSASGVVPVVVLGAYGSYSAGAGGAVVNPRTFTVGGSAAKDGEINSTVAADEDLWLAYKIYNSSPADVVVDMDDEGVYNQLGSCYIQVS